MKKSLLALAAMGAFAGAAQAQSSVTISGMAEIGYTSKSVRALGSAAGAETTQSAITGGHVGTPVLRIEGMEDLGGGMTAGFAIRDELNIADGQRTATTTGAFTESFVSLANKQFGTISAGKMYPATRDLGGVYRFLGDIGRAPTALNSVVHSNTVQYVSPTIQGFSASASYASAGKTVSSSADTNTDPQSQLAIGLRGTIGKGSIAAAIETLKYVAPSAGASQATNTLISVGGNYDFGIAKLGAAYFDQKLTLSDSSDGGKRNAYTIHVAAPVTKVVTVGVSYGNVKVTPAAGGAEPKDTIMTIGGQYAFSKRTSIYASYQQVTNSDANNALMQVSSTGINNNTIGATRGLSVVEINGGTGRGFGLTAVHTF